MQWGFVEGSLESNPYFSSYVALLSFVDINFWSLKLGLASWSFLCGPYFANNWLRRNGGGVLWWNQFFLGGFGPGSTSLFDPVFLSIYPSAYLLIYPSIYLSRVLLCHVPLPSFSSTPAHKFQLQLLILFPSAIFMCLIGLHIHKVCGKGSIMLRDPSFWWV